MVRVSMQAPSQPITNVKSEIGEGNSIVNRQPIYHLEKRTRESTRMSLTTRTCHVTQFLAKDEAGFEVPNLLTLHYQRELKLRLRIPYSSARSYANHRRAFSSYFWVRWTRLAGEDGRLTCVVQVPATEVYDFTAARWRTCSWVLKPFT